MAPATAPTVQQSNTEWLPPGYQVSAQFRDVFVPLILFYSILLPAGLAVNLSGVVISPYRMAALVLMPFAIRRMIALKMTPNLPDVMIFLGSIWALAAMLAVSPLREGLEGGGSFVIDGFGSYLVGRAYMTDARKVRTFLLGALPGVLGIAAILTIESITHTLLVAPLFPDASNIGLYKAYETRMGLLRARAVFPHSIAAGMFMASLVPLYFLSRLPTRTKYLGFVASAIGAFFSVSSSAFLTLLLQFGLISYRTFWTRLLGMRERLGYLLIAVVFLYVTLDLASEGGAIKVIIKYASLNPQTGYYRLLIWEYGTLSVANNPWFGIGNAYMPRLDWMVMDTIDNHWLMLAVKYGLPSAILIGLGVVVAIWMCVARNLRLNDFDRATTNGVVFALAGLWLVAWTSALWANHVSWFMMLVGVVSALIHQLPESANQKSRPTVELKPIAQRRSA
ncbi:MAG: O-antigen ligase family protein [Pseudomonadota bacterium]